jgi:hypothetical protein
MLHIVRSTTFADLLRSYSVMVDGYTIGHLRRNQTLVYPLPEGAHDISVRIDWCGSDVTRFVAGAEETVMFECGSNLTGWRLLVGPLYVLFRRNSYLWIRRIETEQAAAGQPSLAALSATSPVI